MHRPRSFAPRGPAGVQKGFQGGKHGFHILPWRLVKAVRGNHEHTCQARKPARFYRVGTWAGGKQT